MSLISWGWIGLFCGTFLSATFIPFSSDIILIGFYELDYAVVPCIALATVGNFLGGITNYFIGYKSNSERLIKRFKLNQQKLDRWEQRLQKWGIYLGLISWFPIVGEPMVAACGFFKVKFWPLAAMMFLGKLIRYTIVTMIYFGVFSG